MILLCRQFKTVLFKNLAKYSSCIKNVNLSFQHRKPQHIIKYSPKTYVFGLYFVGQCFRPIHMAPQVGFEPTTPRLTAECYYR